MALGALWPTPPVTECESTDLGGNLRNGFDMLLLGLGVGVAGYIVAVLVSGKKEKFVEREGKTLRPHPFKLAGVSAQKGESETEAEKKSKRTHPLKLGK